MSLTPPPPPPPNNPSGMVPSGCKTPILAPGARRLSTANLSASSSTPSPNQLREILADITKQVNNSPQSRLAPLSSSSSSSSSSSNSNSNNSRSSTTTTTNIINNHTPTTTSNPSNHTRPTPIRSNHHPNPLNTFMRPSQRETGPVTRSRSMLRLITPRSSLTPRATRSNTPITNENQSQPSPSSSSSSVLRTPRTPFTAYSSPSHSVLGSPASTHQANRQATSNARQNPIAPLRYRALSSVSSLTNPSSPSTSTTTPEFIVNQTTLTPMTPSSSSSQVTTTTQLPSLRLRSNLNDPSSSSLSSSSSSSSSVHSTPPLTPSSSLNGYTTLDPNLIITTTNSSSSDAILPSRERRGLDRPESPIDHHHQIDLSTNPKPLSNSTTSLAKRRRKNPSGLGRL